MLSPGAGSCFELIICKILKTIEVIAAATNMNAKIIRTLINKALEVVAINFCRGLARMTNKMN